MAARVTRKQAAALGIEVPPQSKYRNCKTTVDGIVFASKREASRYAELKLLERAGKIRHLELQPEFRLEVNGYLIAVYRADFSYVDGGVSVTEDCKGYRTAVYRIKRKLVKALFGVDVLET